MNDGNDKHEGAWWGNLETLKPSQVQSDYSYVDEDDRRKKFIIIAAAIGSRFTRRVSKMRTAISLPERPTTPKISGSIAPIR